MTLTHIKLTHLLEILKKIAGKIKFISFLPFSEYSQPFQHLFNNYKRIPEILSMDSLINAPQAPAAKMHEHNS